MLLERDLEGRNAPVYTPITYPPRLIIHHASSPFLHTSLWIKRREKYREYWISTFYKLLRQIVRGYSQRLLELRIELENKFSQIDLDCLNNIAYIMILIFWKNRNFSNLFYKLHPKCIIEIARSFWFLARAIKTRRCTIKCAIL